MTEKRNVELKVEFQAEFTIPSLGTFNNKMQMDYPLPEIRMPFYPRLSACAISDIDFAGTVPEPGHVWVFERSGGQVTETVDNDRKVLIITIPYVLERIV